jgi:hypothetical protein
VKLIEDAEAAQLRYQSPKQVRPDRDEQRYHKPGCHSHECARSYSARKHLLFAGRHFNLPKAGEILPLSWVNYNKYQTIISPFLIRPALLWRFFRLIYQPQTGENSN